MFLKDVDIDNAAIPNKIFSGEKNYKIEPLHVVLLKTSTFVKSYGSETKWMYFLIEDGKLLEKYNIWSKVSNSIKKELDVTDFLDKKYPK